MEINNNFRTEPSRVWLLIPCFNVAAYLPKLLGETSAHIPPERTLLINDGSTDATSEVIARFAVHMISHPRNLGKGAALKTGFNCLKEHKAEWCITMDGDGQHEAKYLPDFLEAAADGRYDLIIGNRQISGSDMPGDRRFSNWTTSRLLSLVTRQRILDAQCGYRAIRMSALTNLNLDCNRYDLETELLIKLAHSRQRIGWLSISTRYTSNHSSINRLTDTLRFIKVIAKLSWEC